MIWVLLILANILVYGIVLRTKKTNAKDVIATPDAKIPDLQDNDTIITFDDVKKASKAVKKHEAIKVKRKYNKKK